MRNHPYRSPAVRAAITAIRSDDPPADRFVTPSLVLVVGLVAVVIGFVADRSFDAGFGTAMVVLAICMFLDEYRARAYRQDSLH